MTFSLNILKHLCFCDNEMLLVIERERRVMSITEAISEWREVIGDEHILTGDRLTSHINNLSGTSRDVPALLLPENTEEVRKIVLIAAKHQIPLYPISTGKNWGMGSKLPVRDGCVIVELSLMNRIIEVNKDFAYAVIEPGVTQKQLYDYISSNNLPLIMDVTGSGKDSSIIGNSLDRGVGYFTDRGEEISALKVVLPDGDILDTGYGHFSNAKAKNLYKHGIGPSLDGLFLQANLGIVVQATINLMYRHESSITFIAKLRDRENFSIFIDRIRQLRFKEILKSVVHIANRERSRISLTPLIFDELCRRYPNLNRQELRSMAEEYFDKEFYGYWSATGRLFGTEAVVKDAKRQIKSALGDIADIMFLTDELINLLDRMGRILSFIPQIKRKHIILSASKMVYKFTTGIPTDDAIKSVYWPLTDPPDKLNPDNSSCGVIYYLPIIPIDGNMTKSVIDIIQNNLNKDGYEPAITLNTINNRVFETVVSIAFPRNSDETVKAHDSVKRLNRLLRDEGIYPYRAGIELMDEIIDREDIFFKTVSKIKQTLDPHNIVSPGRYNII